MPFSIEEWEERCQRLAEAATDKFECDRSDEEALSTGVTVLFDGDGNACSDVHFCCGKHLVMMAVAVKEILFKIAEERCDMPLDDAQELFDERDNGNNIFETIDEEDMGTGGGWLDNFSL